MSMCKSVILYVMEVGTHLSLELFVVYYMHSAWNAPHPNALFGAALWQICKAQSCLHALMHVVVVALCLTRVPLLR
jgi:hypothetical protein